MVTLALSIIWAFISYIIGSAAGRYFGEPLIGSIAGILAFLVGLLVIFIFAFTNTLLDYADEKACDRQIMADIDADEHDDHFDD